MLTQIFLAKQRRRYKHKDKRMGQFPFRLGGANSCVVPELLGSFRFEDEDEDDDEDEALCFRHNEIFKLFRLQLNRDDEVDCNNIVTPSLSRI